MSCARAISSSGSSAFPRPLAQAAPVTERWCLSVMAEEPLCLLREAWLLICSESNPPAVYGAGWVLQFVSSLHLWGDTCRQTSPLTHRPRAQRRAPLAKGSWRLSLRGLQFLKQHLLGFLRGDCFICCLVILTYSRFLINVFGPSHWLLDRWLYSVLLLTTPRFLTLLFQWVIKPTHTWNQKKLESAG